MQEERVNPHILDYLITRPGNEVGAQLPERRLGVPPIGGVEGLGEPVVDFGEHRARLGFV